MQLDTRFNQQPEGDYGFRLVPVSGAGLTDGAPKAGAAPEMRVHVDVTPPMIEVYKPTADPNQRKGEFVIVVRGCEDDSEARLIEGQRLYAKLSAHLKPSVAAKLAADISGAPRKALYGGGEG